VKKYSAVKKISIPVEAKVLTAKKASTIKKNPRKAGDFFNVYLN
jgi:hypothetical protein